MEGVYCSKVHIKYVVWLCFVFCELRTMLHFQSMKSWFLPSFQILNHESCKQRTFSFHFQLSFTSLNKVIQLHSAIQLSAVTSPLLGTARDFAEEFSWTPALFSVLLRLYSQCYCQYQWALNLLDSWYFDCLMQQWSVYRHFSYWLTFCF